VNGPGTVTLILRSVLVRADDTRHRNGPAIPVDHRARLFDVDAVERGGETIGIAFAPLLAVGDDVEAGALLVAYCKDRGVVLCRFKLVRCDKPQVVGPHPRYLF
jgi:hypothetical protein